MTSQMQQQLQQNDKRATIKILLDCQCSCDDSDCFYGGSSSKRLQMTVNQEDGVEFLENSLMDYIVGDDNLKNHFTKCQIDHIEVFQFDENCFIPMQKSDVLSNSRFWTKSSRRITLRCMLGTSVKNANEKQVVKQIVGRSLSLTNGVFFIGGKELRIEEQLNESIGEWINISQM